ncbi:MAG TPA: hypothetical protein VKZ83_12865 [Phototrophicaceae bacterium]|nr:hypothetical protein [Phototrophicaceae bacterium]
MRRPPVSAVLLVVGATVVLTGCAAYDPDEPIDQLDRVVEDVPVPDVPDPGSDEPQLGPVPGTWVCTYEPPPDDDWRDDVVCSDGAETHQPYLDEWNPVLTEDEVWEAVLEYEDYLNANFPASEDG